MTNLINDISTLTTIPTKYLAKLNDKALVCICDSVEESLVAEQEITEINIGIGTLYIKLEGELCKYKFIPSNELQKAVKATILNRQSSLTHELETTLVNKIMNSYKDFM